MKKKLAVWIILLVSMSSVMASGKIGFTAFSGGDTFSRNDVSYSFGQLGGGVAGSHYFGHSQSVGLGYLFGMSSSEPSMTTSLSSTFDRGLGFNAYILAQYLFGLSDSFSLEGGIGFGTTSTIYNQTIGGINFSQTVAISKIEAKVELLYDLVEDFQIGVGMRLGVPVNVSITSTAANFHSSISESADSGTGIFAFVGAYYQY